MAKLKTNEQFIKECIEVHGNKYDYSETFYTGAHNVITIICPIHGSFQQKAYRPGCHAEKERRCKEANILLINVEERDWKNNRKSIKNLLFTKIHTKNKVCNLRTFKN